MKARLEAFTCFGDSCVFFQGSLDNGNNANYYLTKLFSVLIFCPDITTKWKKIFLDLIITENLLYAAASVLAQKKKKN